MVANLGKGKGASGATRRWGDKARGRQGERAKGRDETAPLGAKYL